MSRARRYALFAAGIVGISVLSVATQAAALVIAYEWIVRAHP